jgi:hypothetical protein
VEVGAVAEEDDDWSRADTSRDNKTCFSKETTVGGEAEAGRCSWCWRRVVVAELLRLPWLLLLLPLMALCGGGDSGDKSTVGGDGAGEEDAESIPCSSFTAGMTFRTFMLPPPGSGSIDDVDSTRSNERNPLIDDMECCLGDPTTGRGGDSVPDVDGEETFMDEWDCGGGGGGGVGGGGSSALPPLVLAGGSGSEEPSSVLIELVGMQVKTRGESRSRWRVTEMKIGEINDFHTNRSPNQT